MRTVARLLIAAVAFAALLLLASLASSTAWLWLLLAGVVLLLVYARSSAYARSGAYPALVLGALLAGAAFGILLELALEWEGAFLMSVGAAAIAVEAVEERPGHWAFVFGVAFVGVGAAVGLAAAGTRGYLAATLVAVALALVAARRRR